MSGSAVVVMVLMLTVFWGGFGVLLILALKRQHGATRRDRTDKDSG